MNTKKLTMVSGFVVFSLLLMGLTSATHIEVYPNTGDSIQNVLEKAMPGDEVHLNPGVYYQDFNTVRNGASDKPIKIIGSKDSIVKGAGNGRVVQVFHDYIQFIGFTIDGLAGSDSNSMGSYRDKLLYVQGSEARNGVNGLKILNMTFKNSGGEAVRLRYFVTNAEVAYCNFDNIGVYDFKFNGGGKNGEAIYVGTSSNQWADGKNPTAEPDESVNNWIHHNYFNTRGNEAVDIKEGATKNIVEYNVVTGQKDADSAGLDSRGDGNIFRYNEVYGCSGAGIRFGGNTINGYLYGNNNEAYGNKIYNNANGGIKFMTKLSKNVCGNEMSGNTGGNMVGSYGSLFNPTSVCNFELNEGGNNEIPQQNNTTPSEGQEVIEDGNPTITNLLCSASSCDMRNGGQIANNTLDGDLNTRWSAEGDGQWIKYDLKGLKKVDHLDIAFHQGDSRIQYFEIQTSEDNSNWKRVYSGQSSGKTNGFQKFDFENVETKYVKIIGHKNTVNNWNSFTEVKIEEENASVEVPSNSTEPEVPTDPINKLLSVIASSFDSREGGQIPENTIDSNLNTRWSAEGDGEYILYTLDKSYEISKVQVAFHKGDSRIQKFEIQTSEDNSNWKRVYSGQSSGKTNGFQTFEFERTNAQYIKIIGHKNNQNAWNSLTEVKII